MKRNEHAHNRRNRRNKGARSDPHGHDHVLEVGLVGHGEQRAAVAVLQFEANLVGGHIGQRVDEVGNVEADFDDVAAVVDIDFFLRFFLLGVDRGQPQQPRFEVDAHAFELVVGQNGHALQRRLQSRALDLQHIAVALGHDALVIGKLAFDELAGEFQPVQGQARLIAGQGDIDHGVVFIAEQAAEFEHGLARQNDFAPLHRLFQRGGGQGHAVTVGGHQMHLLPIGHPQHAVEVVADIVLRHGEVGQAEQALEQLLRQAQGVVAEVGRSAYQRKVFCRQGLQAEAAFGGPNRHLAV